MCRSDDNSPTFRLTPEIRITINLLSLPVSMFQILPLIKLTDILWGIGEKSAHGREAKAQT
ncbi:hypothetical protein GCM10010082_15570 [Kushneria pakistanensis]|uniref:Uncharacterized protein n=1 Tax=Kushneria pakistanensis TaxID=1508770 RepID=A0ABQ3FH27_9GAMM|nr:hypothetical protein GCM10010082_15570 [Kushneria pakistanensis]